MISKPILAAKIGPEDVEQLRFPVIVTPKLDGIRCIVQGGRALSRKFKPIPNDYVRTALETLLGDVPGSLDGELIVKGSFQDVSSAIMSREGKPKFKYHVFDWVRRPTEEYQHRLSALMQWTKFEAPSFCRLVPYRWATNAKELLELEKALLGNGHEGICFRSPDSIYKEGRSTLREQHLVALKRFVDAETFVIGFEGAEANTNAATRDAVGNLKRSSAKAGKVDKGTLGAFVCADHPNLGPTFKIGTGIGLTAKLRQEIWDRRDDYLGKVIKYRYQEQGTKDRPRIPSFLGFRDGRDL